MPLKSFFQTGNDVILSKLAQFIQTNMRTSGKILNPSLKRQIQKTLAQVVVDINSLEEAEEFLKDFFTKAELQVFSKRFAIVYWLKKERSYENIKRNLKVSSATIADMTKLLKKEGVKNAIKKIEAEEWANKWVEKIKRFVKK